MRYLGLESGWPPLTKCNVLAGEKRQVSIPLVNNLGGTMPEAPNISKLTSLWNSNRHSKKAWESFLEAITIDGLRGWTGESVEFRFPIVAIAGENGAGKSTVLKALAASYRATNAATTAGAVTYSPDDFFPNTPWETVSGVTLSYRYRQLAASNDGSLRKATSRWRGAPDRPYRGVYFLDISRIQPANTLIGYGRLAQVAIAQDASPVELGDSELRALNRVLGRTYTQGTLNKDSGKQVGVLQSGSFMYSNFHQGAGEDASLDLIALLSAAPNGSLILIDEAEASLHPKAQRRLVTELVQLATDKHLQIVMTTHSSMILEQLPAVARVLISVDSAGQRQLIYGASAEYSLSLMDEMGHPELDLFCEDGESVYLAEKIFGMDYPDERARVEFLIVGPASAVKTMGRLAHSGRLRAKGLGVLDADQMVSEGCITLPSVRGDVALGAPEREVFETMTDSTWQIVAERLGVSTGLLLDAVSDAMQLANHHLWSKDIAKALSPTMRPSRVWEAAVDVWAVDLLAEDRRKEFSKLIHDALIFP